MIICIIYIICLHNLTVYADSSESNSSDSLELVYIDDFAVSDDNNYIYCINKGYIIRYDANKNKVKKLKKLPKGQTKGCMLMGDYIVFGLTEWYSPQALESSIPESFELSIYKYNLKTKELSIVIKEAGFLGINENKDRIYCVSNSEDISVNIDGTDERSAKVDNWYKSFLKKSKKRKFVTVKETKRYSGSTYRNIYVRNKKGKRIIKRVYEKWKLDKNHIVLKTLKKKNVVLAKNAFIVKGEFSSDRVYYLKNCIVIYYNQFSKYLYRYDSLSSGEPYTHMMVVSYDGKHRKKIY